MALQSGTGIKVFGSLYEVTELRTILKGDYKFLVLGLYTEGTGLAVVSFPTKNFRVYGKEKNLDVDSSIFLDLSTEKNTVIVNNVFDLDEIRNKLSESSGFSHLLFKPVRTDKYSTYLIYNAELVGSAGGVTSAGTTRPCPPDCPQ